MRLFHGTAERFFDSIMSKGIRLGYGETTRRYKYDDTARIHSNCAGRVFLSPSLDDATHHGLAAIGDDLNEAVIVFEVEVPDFFLRDDSCSLGCMYIERPIPVSWIVDVHVTWRNSVFF